MAIGHGIAEKRSAAAARQTGITDSAYNARRRATMQPGPAGIGVMRKIQLARMSVGIENTVRSPTTQRRTIVIVEHSTPPNLIGLPCAIAASSDFLYRMAQANPIPM